MFSYLLPFLIVVGGPAIAQRSPSAAQPVEKRDPCTPLSDETPFIHGMAGNDRLYGGSMPYRTFGDEDNDFIVGSSNGEINGGDDADTLVGGGESDRFIYDGRLASLPDRKGQWSPKWGDTIVDFRAKDNDRIDLTGLRMDGPGAPGGFHWGGVEPGRYSVWLQPRAGDTIVLVDINGDAFGDVVIRLLGDVRLTPKEFCGVEEPVS